MCYIDIIADMCIKNIFFTILIVYLSIKQFQSYTVDVIHSFP
jgi:hypothetical protein